MSRTIFVSCKRIFKKTYPRWSKIYYKPSWSSFEYVANVLCNMGKDGLIERRIFIRSKIQTSLKGFQILNTLGELLFNLVSTKHAHHPTGQSSYTPLFHFIHCCFLFIWHLYVYKKENLENILYCTHCQINIFFFKSCLFFNGLFIYKAT